MRADRRVSLHTQSVSSWVFLCAQGGRGVPPSFAVPNSDLTSGWDGTLFLKWSFWKCHGPCPICSSPTRGVSFHYNDGVMSFGVDVVKFSSTLK